MAFRTSIRSSPASTKTICVSLSHRLPPKAGLSRKMSSARRTILAGEIFASRDVTSRLRPFSRARQRDRSQLLRTGRVGRSLEKNLAFLMLSDHRRDRPIDAKPPAAYKTAFWSTAMKHPDSSRVILTRTEENGTSDYQELTINAETSNDASGNPLFTVSQLWGTPDGLPWVGSGVNPGQVIDPWFPNPGGVRFRLFTFLPTPTEPADPNAQEALLLEHAQSEGLSNFVEAFDPERPGMHISDSVDFVLVLSGEIVLELELREVLCRQGDVIIMRGGWHNWRNETDQPCTVASVMVGAHRK
ncbi:cupin domain-containing protein [Rhizobium leguminosarum bv. viciae]|nr:cupin domain-containing protein [Rhizobium leguminosarum bv. viciae]